MLARVSEAPAFLLGITMCMAVARKGAYFPTTAFAMFGCVALAALLAIRRLPSAASPAWRLVFPLAMFSVWMGVRADLSQSDQLVLVLIPVAVSLVILVAVALSSRADLALRSVMIGVGLAVAVSAWVGVAFHYLPWAHYDGRVWRGASTLTHPNAAGLVMCLALLVALESRWGSRAKVAVVYVLCVGLIGTVSRGAFVTALAAILVYSTLRGIKTVARPLIVAAGGGLIALVGLLPSMTGSAARPGLAAGGLVLGVAVALLALRRTTVSVAVLLGSLVTLVCVSQFSLNAFVDGPAARFSMSSPDRLMEWRSAIGLTRANLAFGTGLSHDRLTWNEDGVTMSARYVHNEYLQTVVDFGLVGALIACLLGVMVLRFLFSTNLPGQRSPLGCAAIAAGCVAGLFDFVWHIPAIAVFIGLIVGVELSRRSVDGGAGAEFSNGSSSQAAAQRSHSGASQVASEGAPSATSPGQTELVVGSLNPSPRAPQQEQTATDRSLSPRIPSRTRPAGRS